MTNQIQNVTPSTTTKTKTTTNVVMVEKVYCKHYTEVNGIEIQINPTRVEPNDYPNKTVYGKVASKSGTKIRKGDLFYHVAISDFNSKKGRNKIAISDKIKSLNVAGITQKQLDAIALAMTK